MKTFMPPSLERYAERDKIVNSVKNHTGVPGLGQVPEDLPYPDGFLQEDRVIAVFAGDAVHQYSHKWRLERTPEHNEEMRIRRHKGVPGILPGSSRNFSELRARVVFGGDADPLQAHKNSPIRFSDAIT